MANFGSPPTYYDGVIVILQAADAPVPVPPGQPRPGGFWIKGASYAYTPNSFAVVGVGVPAVHIDIRPAVEAMLDGSDGGAALGDVEPTPGTLLLRDDSDVYGGSGRVTSLFTNDVRPLGAGVAWALRDAAGTAQATVTADGLRVPVLAAPDGAPLSMVDPDLDEFLELDSGSAIARVTDARPFEVRAGSNRIMKLWSTSGAPNPAEFDYGVKTSGIVYGGSTFALGTTSVDRFQVAASTTQIFDSAGNPVASFPDSAPSEFPNGIRVPGVIESGSTLDIIDATPVARLSINATEVQLKGADGNPVVRVETSKLGFFGGAAAAKPSVSASSPTLAGDLATALATLGLITVTA